MQLVVNLALGDPGMGDEEFGLSLADTIVAAAAHQLLERLRRDDVYSALHSRAEAIRVETLRSVIEPEVRQAMEEVAQRTDRFGHAQGEPVSLATLVLTEVARFMTEKVRSGGYGSKETTRLEALIAQEVSGRFHQEIASAVAEGKTAALAAVRDEAAGVLATAICRMAGGAG